MRAQAKVNEWMLKCFDKEVARDKVERARRFLEEALELMQACDMPREDVLILLDYVYNRPKGEVAQETAGTLITLHALASCHLIDVDLAFENELKRCHRDMEKIQRKQATKRSLFAPTPRVKVIT